MNVRNATWRRLVTLAGPVLVLALLTEALLSVPPDTSPATVTVLASLTDEEGQAFLNVLDDFEGETGIEVDYQSTRAVHEVLLSQVQSGSPPDVAILSSVGELVEHQVNGDLVPLDGALADPRVLTPYGEPWIPRLGDGHRYWVPVKADVKSLVWHDPDRRPAALTADGDNWCAGMGSDATSGWPGTDWVEDLLLQQAGPDVYEAWATGEPGSWTSPEMRNAWRSWRELLAGSGSDRAAKSLTTDWNDAARQLFDEPGCSLNHMGSVSRGEHEQPSDFVPSAELFPGTTGETAAWEVSGDFAAMFRDTEQAAELIQFLASPGAQRVSAEESPAGVAPPLSASRRVGAGTYGDDEVSARLSDILRSGRQRCLDASDTMPPLLRDAFHQAVLHFLAAPDQDQDPGPLLDRLELVRDDVAARDGFRLRSVCGSGSQGSGSQGSGS